MISLKSILLEISNREITDTYIIDADRAFVGVEHDETPKLSKDIVSRIKKIGDQYGYWYEGAGGDREVVKPIFGKIDYKGSWDKTLSSKKVKNEYVYIYTLFANTNVNNTVEKVISGKGETVFEKALNSRKKWAHEAISNKSEEQFADLMEKFFSRLGLDYYQDSQAEATEKNVKTFIESVESDMWDNWPEGSGPAFEMAFEANTDRDSKLLKKFKTGVFFTGMGHIVLLKILMQK